MENTTAPFRYKATHGLTRESNESKTLRKLDKPSSKKIYFNNVPVVGY